MSRPSQFQSGIRRRELLLTTAMTLLFSTNFVLAGVVKDSLPWHQTPALHQLRCAPDLGRISARRKVLPSRRSSTG